MGAVAWWGLRAYSRASRGMNAVRIRRVSDNAEQDFRTLDNGALDRAAIVTFLTATTGKFVKWYDQTGGGRDAGQTTAANQPAVNLSGIGSLVTADFTAAGNAYLSTTVTATQAQPVTVSQIVKSDNTAAQGETFDSSAANIIIGFNDNNTNPNTIFAYCGGPQFRTAETDSVFHAFQCVVNGASSQIVVDASATAGTLGTAGISSETIAIGSRSGSFSHTGAIAETGLWGIAFTGTQSTNMDTNQHAFWGF